MKKYSIIRNNEARELVFHTNDKSIADKAVTSSSNGYTSQVYCQYNEDGIKEFEETHTPYRKPKIMKHVERALDRSVRIRSIL